jgi:hypothetical protein
VAPPSEPVTFEPVTTLLYCTCYSGVRLILLGDHTVDHALHLTMLPSHHGHGVRLIVKNRRTNNIFKKRRRGIFRSGARKTYQNEHTG